MRILRILSGILIFGVLTVVTQVGGIVFLFSLLAFRLIDKVKIRPWVRTVGKVFSFAILYLLLVLVIVPPIATLYGRVPLPIFEHGNLKPANIWTCLLNRNYVRPRLKEIALKVAEDMNSKFPGATVNYLDANFPFLNNFPLLPHLSHYDGKKLDLSFQYNDSKTGEITIDVPSFTGYGICEEPMEGEEDVPLDCEKKGFWQYSFLRDMVSQDNKSLFSMDNERTSELVNSYAAHDGIGKIFIEPHLKTRLQLTNSKIRFHGCQAVRHDDHIHVQLR